MFWYGEGRTLLSNKELVDDSRPTQCSILGVCSQDTSQKSEIDIYCFVQLSLLH